LVLSFRGQPASASTVRLPRTLGVTKHSPLRLETRVPSPALEYLSMRTFLSLATLLAACSNPQPTDALLISTYKAQRDTFLELRTVLCASQEKRVVMLDPEWSRPEISDKERAQLYPLLKKVNAKGVYYDGNCSFRIDVWSVGFVGGGDYKGYSYRPAEPWLGELVGSPLEKVDRPINERFFVSLKIEDDWYLYLHHWP
jgi:hypothetical protein